MTDKLHNNHFFESRISDKFFSWGWKTNTKKIEPLITYDWFPKYIKFYLSNYDFPVFPEDFAYYLLADNNTLIMVSAMKNVSKNLQFNIKHKELKIYDNKGKLDFIISTYAKNCGFSDLK